MRSSSVKSRLGVWKDVWSEVRQGREGKIMSASYAVAVFVYFLLNHFAPSVAGRLHKIPAIATLLSFRGWLILALVILLLLTLEGVYRVVLKRDEAYQKAVSDLVESHPKTIADLNEAHKNAEVAWLEEKRTLEKERAQTPDIIGKIIEVDFKSSSHGLFITLLVFLRNAGADTTLQPFKLKYLVNGREHEAREENLTNYCLYRRIKKPLWPSFSKEEEYEPLNDLNENNLKPLDRAVFRKGWLRFRIPTMISDPHGDQLTLEVTDATDTVYSIIVRRPWPETTGVIRLIKAVEAEWALTSSESDAES
jgi:hypothetical protein